MNNRTARALAGLVLGLAFASANAFAQAPPPAPGTTRLDTNGDGTQDVAIRRIDTDGVAGTTERVHVDANKNGVIDAGERVFTGVVGYLIVDNVLTIVEDTGTERVKTVIVPFDKDGDGDCDDDGEVTQRNSMPDSMASIGIRLPTGPLNAQLTGATTFEADLNAIAPAGGVDAIPTEIVALSLTGGPQPITVALQPLQPSFGMLVENLNVTTGNLDARLLAQDGTLDSFFDVIVEIDIDTGRLIPQQPLRLQSTTGIYPPAPLQTYFLVNPGIPLLDAATGQLAGFLDRFDFTPHLAPRLPCNCEKVSIKPVVKTEKGKPLVVVSPEPDGAISADDRKVYEVEILIDWEVTIKCDNAGKDGCEANFALAAKSEGWIIDNKPSAPVGLDSFEGPDLGGKFVCAGQCDGEGKLPAKRTTYKVKVKKGSGGEITGTGKLSGVVTLQVTPTDCAGDRWTMVLAYEADVKKGEVRIDWHQSNFDGDRKKNASDKNPLDPSKE